MTIHPHEGLLRAARAQARTPEFKRAYPTRSMIERHLLDRHPERPPGQTALHRDSQERRLAAQPCAAINLRTLLRHGLTRSGRAWVLA